jgi:hypothetical protein
MAMLGKISFQYFTGQSKSLPSVSVVQTYEMMCGIRNSWLVILEHGNKI